MDGVCSCLGRQPVGVGDGEQDGQRGPVQQAELHSVESLVVPPTPPGSQQVNLGDIQ